MTSPADAYFARTGAAGEVLKIALRRRPDDTQAWDAHAAELRSAWLEFTRADPGAASALLAEGMDFVTRHSTPPPSPR